MNEEPESENLPLDFHIDLRPVDTQRAISALRQYMEHMEEQMPIIQSCETALLKAERSEADHEEVLAELNYLDRLFEEDLIPTMRYSFIVFLHTVLETRLLPEPAKKALFKAKRGTRLHKRYGD